MVFQAKHIKGMGRGETLGFPTINLDFPDDVILDDGIYAAWVVVGNKTYKGALHFGPVPTFGQPERSMEVYLLDVTDENLPETKDVLIEIDTVERLRDIKDFAETEDLIAQIALDVEKVNAILK
jgi:riboflavin kinase/FMN adenylyltransferase